MATLVPVNHYVAMTMRATIHLPPNADSEYVRVEVDGQTLGYLRATVYDRLFKDKAAFEQALPDGAGAPYAHLSMRRSEPTSDRVAEVDEGTAA